MKRLLLALLILLITGSLDASAQRKKKEKDLIEATSAEDRMASFERKAQQDAASLVRGIEFRNVGPTIMSGRVVDVDVNPDRPQEFYVAYASGGVWFTNNNGTSFKPIADNLPTQNVGDIAVNWSNGHIWIGSGENNSSRSSYAGTGIYRSKDDGASWEYAGLPDSHHIGRIILDPANEDKAVIAVAGHLYTPNKERGLFVTTDGGKSWKNTLYVDENTSAIDLVAMDPEAQHLFAAMWERSRSAWNFIEGGIGSGVYESNDGGLTWELITKVENGFPSGPDCGRIGLTSYQGPKGRFLYAMVDNQVLRPEKEKVEIVADTTLKKQDFEIMSKTEFLQLDSALVQLYLEDNYFPEHYSVEVVFDMVSKDEISPRALFDYLHDANAELFDTPVTGAEVYAYDLVEKRWTRTHEDYLDNVVYSYGYYFGLIRVHPANPNRLYIAGVPVLTSEDGGASWRSIQGENQHVDHHALWLDPQDETHLISGNDGGINISWDGGENYVKCNSPSVGQFYTVAVDDAKPYRIYGGLQDNGVWVGPSNYQYSDGWHDSGKYPYEFLMGGDGMQVQVDTRTNESLYTGYQFGHYYRIDRETGDRSYIHPSHELGENPLRWNWQTPIHLSRHNQDILYMASNRFHRSMKKGSGMQTLSKELTKGGKKGNVPFGTSTSIDESPLQFGLLYLGTDDGKVWMSDNAGQDWNDISSGLPANFWVTRVEASNHDPNRVYVTLNGYRFDHFDAMVYVSENRGNSWTRIGKDLPLEPVNVILEDPVEESILYLGTDHGLYVSMDRGTSFHRFSNNLPPVAIHDLVMQEREHDLVVGTHGRSIYVANMSYLQESINASDLMVFDVNPIRWNDGWGSNWSPWVKPWEPTIEVAFFSASSEDQSHTIEIWNSEGEQFFGEEIAASPGVNIIEIEPILSEGKVDVVNQTREGREEIPLEAADNGKVYLPVGEYELRVSNGSATETTILVVE